MTNTSVGRSGGMLNGMPIDSRPSEPYTWTRWSVSTRVEQVNAAIPDGNSRTALVSASTPVAGSRTTAALTRVGSPSNSIRDRFTQ